MTKTDTKVISIQDVTFLTTVKAKHCFYDILILRSNNVLLQSCQ